MLDETGQSRSRSIMGEGLSDCFIYYSIYLSSSSPLPEGRVDPQHHGEVRAHRWGRHCCPRQRKGALAGLPSQHRTPSNVLVLLPLDTRCLHQWQCPARASDCSFFDCLHVPPPPCWRSQAPAQQRLPNATFSTPAPCHTSSICRQSFSVQQDKQRSNADYIQD